MWWKQIVQCGENMLDYCAMRKIRWGLQHMVYRKIEHRNYGNCNFRKIKRSSCDGNPNCELSKQSLLIWNLESIDLESDGFRNHDFEIMISNSKSWFQTQSDTKPNQNRFSVDWNQKGDYSIHFNPRYDLELVLTKLNEWLTFYDQQIYIRVWISKKKENSY